MFKEPCTRTPNGVAFTVSFLLLFGSTTQRYIGSGLGRVEIGGKSLQRETVGQHQAVGPQRGGREDSRGSYTAFWVL